ncbi:efflux RND transporter periplasmic adaptor subunit [Pararhizobium sp.]|uniref:efflux RND transporter periplasmic adaptor subunit n=1 Tax=Pararhizobium sp. TaxID=1977563 RepID=UPI002723AC5D|nr:efflux RND transporter periplasmic adaptor subunit [Pararhizobium sp.]MDO9415004.1 efflux RND transporter periplasmic adaptor subunit [Pararhizobium sp.]
MSQKMTAAFGLSAVLIALAGEPAIAAEEAAPATTEQTLPSIVVTKAEKKTIIDRVIATGSVQAVEEVYVAPLVEGLSIKALNADVGDRVEAGSTIAVLNDDTLLLQKSQNEANLAKAKAGLAQIEAQLAEAQANADEAVRVSKRSETLSKSGTLSQAQADQNKAGATAALARLNSAQQSIEVSKADIKVVESQIADIDLRLARTSVTSPVSGTVSVRNARVGAIAAGAGQPMFTIIKDGDIELKAEVSENDILKLATGQKARVTLAGGSTSLEGTIRLIQPTIDPQTRLGGVYIKFAEPEKARVGMYGSADITVEEKQAIILPLTAVTVAHNEATARKVEDGIVKLVKVETGIQDGQFIEITSGLSAGDDVVAKAGAYVRDGDRIKPVQSAAVAAN